VADTKLTRAMLAKAANEADEAAAECRSGGVSLINDMHAEAAGFTGAAGTAFRNVLGECMQDVNAIVAKLEEMSNNARVSAKRLTEQDEAAASSVNGVATTSGGPVTAGLT